MKVLSFYKHIPLSGSSLRAESEHVSGEERPAARLQTVPVRAPAEGLCRSQYPGGRRGQRAHGRTGSGQSDVTALSFHQRVKLHKSGLLFHEGTAREGDGIKRLCNRFGKMSFTSICKILSVKQGSLEATWLEPGVGSGTGL